MPGCRRRKLVESSHPDHRKLRYNDNMTKQTTTLIGSYRKDIEKLRIVFEELSSNFELICPKSVEFDDYSADFVRTSEEAGKDANTIEEGVLERIRQSDFVWLFAPEGYVGVSAAFELGFAHSLGVPVFTDEELQDEMLKTMITKKVANTAEVPIGLHKAGSGVSGLQRFYKRTAQRRGWSGESPKDTMLLLTEEMGELARAIRKTEGLKRDSGYEGINLQDELADVQLYLVHLANSLEVELSEAITQKEHKNRKRHENNNE